MRLIKNKPIDIDEVLNDAKPRGIIHCGAFLAEELPIYQAHSIENRCWIEADPDTFKKLKEIIPPHDTVINVAVWDVDGFASFNVMSNGASSSLLQPKTHLLRYPEIKLTGSKIIETRRIDNLIKDGLIDISKYDYLHMDLQGGEMFALHGFCKNIKNINYILSEINYEEVYEGCRLVDEFDFYLLELGFVKQWATIHETVGWGDAYYKRV